MKENPIWHCSKYTKYLGKSKLDR